VICATHSPLLTSLPGAQILELSDEGISPRRWRDLDLTKSWLRFLEEPDSYLKYLTGDGAH
jgi:predicted ATPase